MYALYSAMLRQTRVVLTLIGTYYYVTVYGCVEANIAIVSACLPTMRPVAERLFPAFLISRVFSNRRSQNLKDEPFKRSSRAERGEEFQRLPDNTPEAITSKFKARTRCEPSSNSGSNELELAELAEPQKGIAVQKTFSAY